MLVYIRLGIAKEPEKCRENLVMTKLVVVALVRSYQAFVYFFVDIKRHEEQGHTGLDVHVEAVILFAAFQSVTMIRGVNDECGRIQLLQLGHQALKEGIC